MTAETTGVKHGGIIEQELERIRRQQSKRLSRQTVDSCAEIAMYYPQYEPLDILNMPIGNYNLLAKAVQRRRNDELTNMMMAASVVMNADGFKLLSKKIKQANDRLGGM